MRRIVAVLTRHGFHEIGDRLWSGIGRGKRPELISPEESRQGEGERRRLPPEQRFCRVLEDLGPTFIKLGQVLSTRHDLLPGTYIRALARLQDDVDPLPFKDIAAEIERGLGRPIDEVYDHVEPDPLAAASIAQVHRASLVDGTKVVIKVQRPGTAETIASDMDVLYAVARMLDATVEEARQYDPVGIVRQFEAGLREELDYTREARNMNAICGNFDDLPWLSIPACYDDASCPTVLTQERIEGVSLYDLLAKGDFDRAQLIDRIAHTAYKMIFVDGFFHADPHPGNILVTGEGTFALIDFGLVGRVSASMREQLIQLALGVYTRDVGSLARFFYRLGSRDKQIDLQSFRRDIEGLLERYLGLRLHEIDTSSLIGDLFEVALRYGIQVPSDYALLVKTIATIEGVVRTVDPDLDIMEVAGPFAQRLLAERYGPQEVVMRLARLGLGAGGLLQDMPVELEQVSMDLRSGRISFQVESEDIRELSDRINGLGTRVFLGMIAAAALVSTTLVFSRFPTEVLGPERAELVAWVVGTLVAVGLGTVGTLVVAAATWHISATRFSRVRVRSLFSVWRWLFRKQRMR